MCAADDGHIYTIEDYPELSKHGEYSGHPEGCFGCKIKSISFGTRGRHRDRVEEDVYPDGRRVKAVTGTDGSIRISHADGTEQVTLPHPKER